MLNQSELSEKLNSENLSKSQKRHIKRVIKKRDIRDKHIDKLCTQQMTSTKFIKENHNNGDYTKDFTIEASNHYLKTLWNEWQLNCDNGNRYLLSFRRIKSDLQSLLLQWNPEVPRNDTYNLIKTLLDTYRENKEDGNNLLSVSYHEFTKMGMFN